MSQKHFRSDLSLRFVHLKRKQTSLLYNPRRVNSNAFSFSYLSDYKRQFSRKERTSQMKRSNMQSPRHQLASEDCCMGLSGLIIFAEYHSLLESVYHVLLSSHPTLSTVAHYKANKVGRTQAALTLKENKNKTRLLN